MNCPYCGKEMEPGLIESSEPINFLKELHFVNRPKESDGEFILAKPKIGRHAKVDVNLCRDCRKILINY